MKRRREGFVLVSVLVVTVMAAMVAASLLYRMQAESSAGVAIGQSEQAYAAALSGIHTALAVLTTPPSGGGEAGPEDTPTEPPLYIADLAQWYDNPDIFRGRLVVNDGANRWYFTVYAPNFMDDQNVRYGLIDESGKLDVNRATERQLEVLPGMAPELRDALLDYIDRDEDTRSSGAEQDYYDERPVPYFINRRMTTVEELLLVKGFTGVHVYGEDGNFNGLLEPNEDDGREVFPPDNSDGRLDMGLWTYLTVTPFTLGRHRDPQGLRRININQASPDDLAQLGLSSQTIQGLASYRQGSNGRPGRTLRDASEALRAVPGMSAEELNIIMTYTSAASGRNDAWQGLVNFHTAPAEVVAAVLTAIPGIDHVRVASEIVETRQDLTADERTSTAWLYNRQLLDANQYTAIAPLLTPRGYQYRVRCIGFGVPCGRLRVLEAVIDTVGTSRITYLRDITRLGVPVALDVESRRPGVQ
jgi:type II secretory pathway component PulK